MENHPFDLEGIICTPGQKVRNGSSRKTSEINGNMGAVFQPESLGFFPIGFWLAFRFFWPETLVNHRKKSENFPVGILLPYFIIFRRFPAVSSDFSASFHPVPVKFQLFPETEIIDLGTTIEIVVIIFFFVFLFTWIT
jgi:hypothetical protein